jgi:hypothetical protein
MIARFGRLARAALLGGALSAFATLATAGSTITGNVKTPNGYEVPTPVVCVDLTGTYVPCGGGGGGSVTITSPSNFTPAQVSVGTSATLIAAARTGRQLLTIVNTTTTAIYLGGSGVTTSTGHLLPGVVGASLTIPYTGAMYGVVASSTATVTEAETY